MSVDRLFELLKDGQWYDVSEVAKTLNLPEQLMENVLHFFTKFDFIQFDPSRRKVAIDSSIKKFFLW